MKDISNIGAERHAAGCGQPVRCVAAAVFSFYIFAGLLNGVAMQKNIELLPYGTRREVCLSLIRPVAWLSRHTHAADLRTGLDQFILMHKKKDIKE